MENILELKIINELNEYLFFIPSYQRGYKWTSNEVLDLLNDIDDFTPRIIDEDDKEKTWYCLQPIVVKEKSNKQYEVIDGQQRLTTIYLVLNYLNQDFIPKKRDKLFTIDYETRTNTKKFLQELEEEKSEHDNIDFYYIHEAYKSIAEWFENKPTTFDQNEFRSKLKFNSKIIWYESIEDDPIS